MLSRDFTAPSQQERKQTHIADAFIYGLLLK